MQKRLACLAHASGCNNMSFNKNSILDFHESYLYYPGEINKKEDSALPLRS